METLEHYRAMIDPAYREILEMTHKGKDIDQAIKEAYAYLVADSQRASRTDSGDFKKLVNTWLGNMKVGQNGKAKKDWKL